MARIPVEATGVVNGVSAYSRMAAGRAALRRFGTGRRGSVGGVRYTAVVHDEVVAPLLTDATLDEQCAPKQSNALRPQASASVRGLRRWD